MSEVIPAEAVEAAVSRLYPGWETSPADWKDYFRRKATEALEAAAPYMQAPGIRRPMEKGALFEELRRLNPSGALLKDIEALEQQD